MFTEDIRLADDEQWLALVPVTTDIYIYNGSNRECVVRFGALSTSIGMMFGPDETIVASETVYIRPKHKVTGVIGSVRVTR